MVERTEHLFGVNLMISDYSPALRRTRRRRWQRDPRLVVAGLVTALAGFFVLAGDVYGALNVGQPTIVHVHAGDSLWNLAAAQYPGSDLRERVAQIIADNHLAGGTISPGQVLELPAP
jgi:hypothetical protein